MAELKLKNGQVLRYDEITDKVTLDGKLTTTYEASFIPNGNDEPTFFGFVHKLQHKCYDIYGGVHDIVDEDKIKL